MTWSLLILSRLAKQLALGDLLSVSQVLKMKWLPHLPGFYMGPEDLDFSPHTCTANTLFTEPSSQPRFSISYSEKQALVLTKGSKTSSTQIHRKGPGSRCFDMLSGTITLWPGTFRHEVILKHKAGMCIS